MLGEGRVRRVHTHILYFSSSVHGRLSPQSSFCDPHLTVFFFCLFLSFFLSLDTNRLRGESSFRPEPLRTPPHEPSRVDIQFYYEVKKIYTDIRLELPKDDQVLLLQGFNDVLYLKRSDGKRFSSATENLKNNSSDQKSRCRTCAQACYSPLKQRERRRERHKFICILSWQKQQLCTPCTSVFHFCPFLCLQPNNNVQ